MFSNFVTFTEVIKLSTNIYHRLQDEIYDEKLFEKDARNYTIFDLVDDKKLTSCISYLDNLWSLAEKLRWLQLIMKFIIDVTVFNNSLITQSWKFGLVNFVEILIEKGADVNVILHGGEIVVSIICGHLEMSEFLQ